MLTSACGGDPTNDSDWSETGFETEQTQDLLPAAMGRFDDLGLTCSLSVSSESASQVVTSIENRGDMEILISPSATPWLAANAPFAVTNEHKQALPYIGVSAIFLPPRQEQFIRVRPGETVSTSYDLSNQYDVEKSGRYAVQMRSPLIRTRISGVDLLLQHDCAATSVTLEVPDLQQLRQPLEFTDSTCLAPEQTRAQWLDDLARTAVNAEAEGGAGPEIIRKWFGNALIGDVFRRAFVILSIRPPNDEFKSDCKVDPPGPTPQDPPPFSCATGGDGTVAWTTPNADRIHLCSIFLGAGAGFATEFSGLANSLIHERTHANGATADEPVGGPNLYNSGAECQALALTDPSVAANNAPTYAFYFADVFLSTRVFPSVIAPLLLQ